MDFKQIKALGIDSAQTYYDFLVANGKGLERIAVYQKISQTNGNYVLTLSKKLFSEEMIVFDIATVRYTLAQVSVVEYDKDRNQLVVHPQPGFEQIFHLVTPDQIMVVSDMKFLVKRVREWYEEYGQRIKIPQQPPGFGYVPQTELQHVASNEQNNALVDIFSSPFSYVWGAPGTGKTKFVLASAILQYVRQGKCVAVVAPTNNALEQSLYGILDVLEAYGVKSEKVLRLGIPSKHFAECYPQCCEIKGVQKKLAELQKQKQIYQKELSMMKFQGTWDVLEHEILPYMNMLGEYLAQRESLQNKLAAYEKDMHTTDILWNRLRDESHKTVDRIEAITHIMNQPFYAAKKFFFHRETVRKEQEKNQLTSLLAEQNKELESLRAQKMSLAKQSAGLTQKLQAEDSTWKLISEIQQKSLISKKLTKVVEHLNAGNFEAVQSQLFALREQGHELLNSYVPAAEESSLESIQSRLKEIQEQMEAMYDGSTAKRLQSVQILAMSIDTFIARFDIDNSKQDDPSKVFFPANHFFLDESGYCSLIKGAALLANRCPITFLGDHMQLPPVCEMDDQCIQDRNNSVFVWAQSALAVESLFTESFDQNYERYAQGLAPSFISLSKTDLTATYRFGTILSQILDQNVYCNGFHSAEGIAPFELVVISSKRYPGYRKRENPAEAEQIKKWVVFRDTDDFAILSPYINQVKLIATLLPKEREKIMTVHASQGREWDTVILSVSDTSDKWFTDSRNTISKGLVLINTAVSRAKRRLILVCDTAYWERQSKQLIGAFVMAANKQ